MPFSTFYLLLSLPPLLFSLLLLGRHRLARPANHGPRSYPIIGCLIAFYQNKTRLLDWYTELLAQSPTQTISLSRLGVGRVVVTANPANVEHILRVKFGNYPKGEKFREILGDFLGNGIFNVDGETWWTQRKVASHEFSSKSLREFVVDILRDEVHNRLVPMLDSAAEEGIVIDLQAVLKRLTYDTICRAALGTDPHCLDLSKPLSPLITAFDTAATISASRGTATLYLSWKINRTLRLGLEKRLSTAVSAVHAAVNDVIHDKEKEKRREKMGENTSDLVSRFLAAGYDGEMVRDMVVSFVMAGRDTSSAAMTWLFWLLSQHRHVETDLLKEIATVSGHTNTLKSNSTTNETHSLGYESLKEMKYMHACLFETMRLYPPVAWDSKHAASDDVLPDGTPIRKGDRVTYFPYGMGRMETIWGSNWFKFKPDRWLNDEPRGEGKVLRAVSPYTYPVFQAGPRVCLGKEMALLQMKYVVASIIRKFEFEPICLKQPVFVPLLTAHMDGGFRVKVKKRIAEC